MCTRRRVIAVWLATALVLAAISAHFFATVNYPHLSDDNQLSSSETDPTADMDPICFVLPPYNWFFVNVWYWLDFTLLAFVPFVVVLAGNCVIITCVVKAVRFRYQQQTPSSANSAGLRGTGGAVPDAKQKAVTSSTVMLMTLSVVTNDWILNTKTGTPHSRRRTLHV